MHPSPSRRPTSFFFTSASPDRRAARARRAAVIASLSLTTALAAAAAGQQPAAPQPPRPDAAPIAPAATTPASTFAPVVERLIADLGSPLYPVREQASEALAARQDLELADLEGILTRPSLMPEQRIRLQALARQRFATTPRGAMGVRFGGVLQQSRIVIDATYEGFNSHDLLKPGDVIVEAQGRPLRGDLARYILRALVFAHDPGDTLPVTIRRGGETLSLTLRLGSFRVLAQQPQGRPLDDLDLARAWAMRSALLSEQRTAQPVDAAGEIGPPTAVAVGPAPITTSLPASQWPTTREQLEARYKQANARLYGQPGQVAIAAGGQFREGGAGVNSADPGYKYAIAQPTHPLEVLTREPTVMPRQRELQILTSIEQRTSDELQRLTTMLETPDMRALPPEQRAQTEEMANQFRDRLQMIKLERAAIEAEQRELGDEPADRADPLLEQ
jgi:hypothetical protein